MNMTWNEMELIGAAKNINKINNTNKYSQLVQWRLMLLGIYVESCRHSCSGCIKNNDQL